MAHSYLSFLLISTFLLITHAASYDYYNLAIEWAGSICATQECNPGDYTGINPKFFNIHGLWPSSFSGADPQNCAGPRWDPSALSQATKQYMQADWAGLYGPAGTFHQHEWEKHGVCWNNPNKQSTNRIEDYFAKVIQVAQQLDIYGALYKNGLAPSANQTYTVEEFRTAVQAAYGVNGFSVNCESRDGTALGDGDDNYFNGFYICLDLNYKPVNCPAKHYEVYPSANGCADDGLSFPPITF